MHGPEEGVGDTRPSAGRAHLAARSGPRAAGRRANRHDYRFFFFGLRVVTDTTFE